MSGDRRETLLNPDTYLCSGFRMAARSDGEKWRKGDIVISNAQLTVEVVDRKGRRS